MSHNFSNNSRRLVPSRAKSISQWCSQLMVATPCPSIATVLHTLIGTHTVGCGVGSQVCEGTGVGMCVGLDEGTIVGT
jgi:hypothetical protein